MSQSQQRVRGFNDSSVVVSPTGDSIKIETHIIGGKTTCHLSLQKARELALIILETVSNVENPGQEE